MHRVIVVGSPRADGRSASLANELFNACIEECPQDGVSIVSVASIEVGPCRGCDACRVATEAPDKLPEDDDNLAICPEVAKSDALVHRCVIHDDMTEVRKHLDAADELIVVSPVYFAGPPAQFKCLIDRLQPYFWSDVRLGAKRPCVLHVVGEGGDPHGFEPLVGCVRSAFSCAGFELELALDWVGKIDESGEITAEAEEYVLSPTDSFAGNWEDDESAAEAGVSSAQEAAEAAKAAETGAASAREAAEVDRASVRGLVESAESDTREGAEPVGAGAASAQEDAEAASGRAVGGFASSGEVASSGGVAPGGKLASNGEPAPGEGIAPRPRARLSFAGVGGADAGDFRGSRDSKGSGSSKGGFAKDARGSKGGSAKGSGDGFPKGSKSGKGGSAKGNATRGGSPKGGGKGGSNTKHTSSKAGRNGSQGSKGGTPKSGSSKGGSSKGGTHRGSSAARQNAKGSGRRGRR